MYPFKLNRVLICHILCLIYFLYLLFIHSLSYLGLYLQGLDATMFLTRCKDRNIKNNLYFTSQLVRNIVMNNEDRVKIINTGVKAFARCENKGADCIYRLAQVG